MKMLEYLVMYMSAQVEGEPEGRVQDAIKQTVSKMPKLGLRV